MSARDIFEVQQEICEQLKSLVAAGELDVKISVYDELLFPHSFPFIGIKEEKSTPENLSSGQTAIGSHTFRLAIVYSIDKEDADSLNIARGYCNKNLEIIREKLIGNCIAINYNTGFYDKSACYRIDYMINKD